MTIAATRVRTMRIPTPAGELDGDLMVPEAARGIVAFAHGSGSSRHSPRNQLVAGVLAKNGIATLLVDLLTPAEGERDEITVELRFNIPLLGTRMILVVDELTRDARTEGLPIGLFGASTGAAAALVAAARRPDVVTAIVSRGGRPDLAAGALPRVRAATLFIVGGADEEVLALNRDALHQMRAPERDLVVITGATHLFEEPGALEQVADLAAAWFARHLQRVMRE